MGSLPAWLRGCLVAIVSVLAGIDGAAAAADGGRVALVIGNAAYRSTPLANPLNDARTMAETLGNLGFKVINLQNATQKQMFEAVRQFGDQLQGGVGLFYYAGHGVQVKGRNFLIPVDAAIEREDEVPYKGFDVGLVLEKMEAAKNPLNIVILDACRNNPFARGSRSAATGLAQMDAPTGAIVAFATAPGAEAADGAGSNGLYTTHLLRNMTTPGLKVEDVFKRTRVAVKQDSAGRQIPWESTSLEGDFYFTPPAGGAAPQAQPPASVETEMWSVISESNSPRAYRAYLEKFPNGRYAEQARAKAEQVAVTRRPSRSSGGFSFSAEEEKMDRATPQGRLQALQESTAAVACPANRRHARVRVELHERRKAAAAFVSASGPGGLAFALAERLHQAGLQVITRGASDYVLHLTVATQLNTNRHLALNEVSVNAAATLTSASGRMVSSRVSREESYAGSDVTGAYSDLVQGQASDLAAGLFADLCRQ
jgi:uncharacterized caspase-like protein